MINVCPYCGHQLNISLNFGVSQCNHCNKFFDSSLTNTLLSASWEARKKNISSESLAWQTKLEKDMAEFVHYFICNLGYSHDEFLSLIKKFKEDIDFKDQKS